MKVILLGLVFVGLLSCKSEIKPELKPSVAPPLTADNIIDSSIAVSGGKRFNNSTIRFNFRGVAYNAKRTNGKFELSRLKHESNDSIRDVLSNTGFTRYINNKIAVVHDSMIATYAASVNSVHYFSVLPFGLNDTAVQKSVLGSEAILGKAYYKIKVTFDEDGGGEDYEDVFVYWINKESFKVDYLAYSYDEAKGKGMRFRQAYNERYVNDLRFVDYNNYKPNTTIQSVFELGKAFENNTLKLVSKIELKAVTVL